MPPTDVPATSEQSANVAVSVLPSADVTAVRLPPTAHGIVVVPAAAGWTFWDGNKLCTTRRSMELSEGGTAAGAAPTAAAVVAVSANVAGVTIASAAVAVALP